MKTDTAFSRSKGHIVLDAVPFKNSVISDDFCRPRLFLINCGGPPAQRNALPPVNLNWPRRLKKTPKSAAVKVAPGGAVASARISSGTKGGYAVNLIAMGTSAARDHEGAERNR